MATINYNGMELEEFTSDKPVIFDPPKKMLVTDDYDFKSCRVTEIIVYDPRRTVCKAIGIHNQSWKYCFLLPDPPKPRRATNRELARWLAQGNGECLGSQDEYDRINSRIAELEEERRWRKFPDEKPKWGEEVIVVDDASKQYIVRFSHDMKWISWGKMNTCESNCVKFWMPLPEPPEVSK